MEQVLTIKLKLHTDSEQGAALRDTLKAYLAACNGVSEYVYETHDLSQSSLNKALYYRIRETWGLRSQMAQSVIKTVIAKYKSMKPGGSGWSKAVFRHGMADLVWNSDYSILNGDTVLSINSLKGRLKVSFDKAHCQRFFEMPERRFGTATMLERHGSFYFHVPVTIEVPDFDTGSVRNVVGVDRGTRFLFTAYGSDGRTVFYPGKHAKHVRARYAYTRKTLQRCGTASSRRRLKAIGQRENRFTQDVNHCAAKALAAAYPKDTLFVLEDLSGMRHMTDKCRIRGKYLLVSWSFYDMEGKLAYKAAMKGQGVIHRNPAYTSQACPKCGHTEAANRNKKLHLFCCENCGYRSNDDRVAAMNLQRMGINYLVPAAVGTC